MCGPGRIKETPVMKKLLVLPLLLSVCLVARAQYLGSGDALGAAPADEASYVVDLISAGNFEQAVGQFSPELAKTLTAERLQKKWQSLLDEFGPFQDREVKATEVDGIEWHIHVVCTFANGYVDAVVTYSTIKDDNVVLGLSFQSASKDPPIAY